MSSKRISVVVGTETFEVGIVMGFDSNDPQGRELIGMMVKDWAEGWIEGDDE